MSETLPGMPPPPPPSKPREASAVILYRRLGNDVEVFWIKREKALQFAGGFYAFPGGKVDAADAQVPVADVSSDARRLVVTAARELFEETGVLLAEGAEKLSAETLATLRRSLLDKKCSFIETLAQNGLRLSGLPFRPAGRWITPPFLPVRFDAHFFLVELPQGAQAEVWPGELTEGAWIRPSAALKRWEDGTALLHPPNLHALQTLRQWTTEENALARLWAPDFCPGFLSQLIEFQEGIRIFPMETATLPPATHTNAYLLGNEELILVDPGSGDATEQARLLELVDGLLAQGKRLSAIVLTHHHGDHVSGAWDIAQKSQLPIWAHAVTAQKVSFPIDRFLEEGEVVTLAGRNPMRWKVLHTPGHAQGHICLVDEKTSAAVVGDMVAGLGTIVIDPPEGNMLDYLNQLKRLHALPVGTLYPAHGAAIPDGPGKLLEYLKHRQEREDKLLSTLEASGLSFEAIVEKTYDDVPPFVLPLAERSTLAILEKLLQEGKVVCRQNQYERI